MRKLSFKKRKSRARKDDDVHFIRLCTLGVAAIFAITVLIAVLAVNLA